MPPPLPIRPLPTTTPTQPPAPTVTVPRVVGLGLYQAEAVLESHGLSVGSVTVQPSNETAGSVV
ncbi:MAG TPA: PASTA domain-containing protein, partial [Pseudonocardia sp.]|nr:PASTA domain-containing protein [Pseudonocardia sp.]